jgi:hypothetical protein
MYDGGVTDQVLPSIQSEIAVFALELLDVAGVVNMFVGAQIVLVGESSSTRWTWIGTLLGREVYGEVDVKKGLADGDVGTQGTFVGSGA